MSIAVLIVMVTCADIAVWDNGQVWWHGIRADISPQPSPDDRCYLYVSNNDIIRVLVPKVAGS